MWWTHVALEPSGNGGSKHFQLLFLGYFISFFLNWWPCWIVREDWPTPWFATGGRHQRRNHKKREKERERGKMLHIFSRPQSSFCLSVCLSVCLCLFLSTHAGEIINLLRAHIRLIRTNPQQQLKRTDWTLMVFTYENHRRRLGQLSTLWIFKTIGFYTLRFGYFQALVKGNFENRFNLLQQRISNST